ncbi:hypothetical protein DSO57_1000637 [Entomophthora muscae]|uniref:Uncharacterized protein n=1 Tax=Entomophthora muscae TaxID=34485 RepID=A0ACC2S078_9FUNG|nr:hypothetical protein DSO57_1000637 [Entomophthora muscae]
MKNKVGVVGGCQKNKTELHPLFLFMASCLCTCLGVATELPDSPVNVSYNTQGALNELPLDVSNNMEKSDGNIKLQALSPN